MAVKQLSDGGSEGVVMGQSADDKISHYGVDPVAQIPYSASISGARLTSLVVLSGGSNYGYSSSAQIGYVTGMLTALRDEMVRQGFWPSTT